MRPTSSCGSIALSLHRRPIVRQTLTRRLESLEEAATVKPRIRFIFDEGQGDEAIAAEITEMKASGVAKDSDVFHTIRWENWRPRNPDLALPY